MLKDFKQKPNKTQDRLGSKVLGLESGHKTRDTSLKTPDSGLKTQHRSVRGIGFGSMIGLWLMLCGVALGQPSVPPPKTTAFTRGLIGTNTTSAEFRAALGFLSTNNTVITNYEGNGASITNLNADELRSGTVPLARLTGITATQVADASLTTNKVDATFHALLGGGGSGDVTQSGLAAGSYPISPQSLTGFLTWTSTNTVNAGSSNAITVVSNATGWASVAFSGASAVSRGFDLTFYATSDPLVFTNGTTAGFFCAGGFLGDTIILTNATYPDAAGDGSDTAAINGSQENFPNFDDSQWIDNNVDANPLTVVSVETFTYSPLHAKVNADLSDSFNIPLPAGGLTNNWQSSAGQINLTNAIRPTSINMGYDYGISLNYRAGAGDNTNYIIITNGAINLPGAGNNGIYGTVSGILWPQGYISYNDGWVLMRSAKFSMEHTADFSHVRFGDDHRQDQLVKLALSGTGETHGATNAYSAMLGFHSVAAAGLQGMTGIQGRHEDGNTDIVYTLGGVNYTESETWFFSLIPEPKAHTNGGWGTNDLGRAYMVGRKDGAYFNKAVLATNGISSFSTVAAAAITATGWTNIWSTNNATVYVERGASVAVTLKNRANATLNTFTAGTTPLTIALQPGWGFSASGNLSGNAVPF